MFTGVKHKFADVVRMFTALEHKFQDVEYKKHY